MIGSSPSTPCHCGGRSTTCCRSRRIAMTETSRTYTTKTGRELTDSDIEKLADEAEQGYDVDDLRRRRRGRPMLGSAPAEVVPVRFDPELKQAVEDRARDDETPVSARIREAIRRCLDGTKCAPGR